MMFDGENDFFSLSFCSKKVLLDVKYCLLSNQQPNRSSAVLSHFAFLLLPKTLKDYTYQRGDVVLSYNLRALLAHSLDI